MLYCVKCGVELAESELKCPLCGTVVYHPDLVQPEGKTLYPPDTSSHEETVKVSGVLFVFSVVFLIPIVLTLMFDWKFNNGVTWSGYTVSAIILLYILVILPIWFKKPNPVIFSSVDFIATTLFLLLIDYLTQGNWFIYFALPTAAGAALITLSVISLIHYVRRGHLYIFGGAVIASGFFMVAIEFLINNTFQLRNTLIWSIYPFVFCFLIGIALIVIAICKPLRDSLHKIFFV